MVEIIEDNLLESGCTFICHQVNAQGIMGSGIAEQIRKKWSDVYYDYRYFIEHMLVNEFIQDSKDILGLINFTRLHDAGVAQYVVNFYSQDNYMPRNICHTNYDAFRACCKRLKNLVSQHYVKEYCTIGFPYKIGCGLAGGDWNIVYNIIEEEFKDGYNVKIYKLKEEN